MKNQKQFYKLYQNWYRDTLYLSYHDTDHPDYKAIIALGKEIVPLLLANLWSSWLPILALPEILGQTPFDILPEDRGMFDNLNEKWYKWGQSKGLIV